MVKEHCCEHLRTDQVAARQESVSESPEASSFHTQWHYDAKKLHHSVPYIERVILND